MNLRVPKNARNFLDQLADFTTAVLNTPNVDTVISTVLTAVKESVQYCRLLIQVSLTPAS
jgi:hypothetical protein